MPEFNQLPVMEDLAGNDVIPCVDTSDGQTLKQLPVSLLPTGPQSSALQVGPTPPASTSALIWLQTDSQGNLIEQWQRSRDGSRWVSQRTWTVGYFKDSGTPSFYKAGCPVPGPHIWLDSLYVSALSRGDFDPGDKRIISIALVDETPSEDVLANYSFEGLSKGERVSEFMPLGIAKPQSEMVAIWMRSKKEKSPPPVQFVQVSLTLRKVYAITA